MKIKKDELVDALDYYKKLQVVFIDADENVLFLWRVNFMYSVLFCF